MAKIKLTLPGLEIPVNGKQVSFTAPCDCSVADGIQIDGVDYDIVDSIGRTVSFGRGVWDVGAVLTVVLDVTNRKAYLQNQNGYTKAETVTRATAELYGLVSDATPDDVFSWLGQYNTHWWSRYSDQSYYEVAIGDAYPYASGYNKNNVIIYNNNGVSKTNPITIKTADSVVVDTAGNVSLANPTVYTDDATDWEFAYNFESSWLGKYCQVSVATESLAANEIFYVPSNAAFYYYSYDVGVSVAYKVVSRLISTGETTYVHATDRNAYPDSGTKDGLTYQYLGIPFEKFPTMLQFATGSYIGTGTYGASNPNSLTFDFVPKAIWFYGNVRTAYNSYGTTPFLMLCETKAYSGGVMGMSYTNGNISVSGTTVSWYETGSTQNSNANYNAYGQLNGSGSTYYYLAIG